MKAQGRSKSLIGCVVTFMVVLFIAGCADPDENGAVNGEQASNILVQADAGDIVAVRVNQSAILDGSASSTTSSRSLSYAWSFSSTPDASNAQLQNVTSATPNFTPDVAGTYTVQLVVSDGSVSSQRAVASVEASIDGHYTGIRVHTSYSSLCSDCHDGRFSQRVGPIDPVLPKLGNHPATSNMCQSCHTTFGFEIINFVDHLEVFGNCSSCHDGVTAIGKSVSHVTTSVECDNCHTTDSFLAIGPDGRFDHSGITRDCASCHNGTTAIGKHVLHPSIPSGADCSFCHTTESFLNAYPDHSTITDNCASCHNGIDATGPTVGHPAMTVDCGICHTTTTFSLGGVFNHRLVAAALQPCADCHNDNNSINARGKSLNHLVTAEDCGVCHGVAGGNFANGVYDHTGIVNNCVECHGVGGNGTGLGKPTNHLPTNQDCSVCHTVGTFTTGVFDHDPGIVDFVTCTSCHDGVITAGKDVNHVPTISDCRVCHTSTDTFVGTLFNHTGIIDNCASCHTGTISKGKSSNHLPTNRDCSDCHLINQFDSFIGASFDHLGVTNNCASCHDGVIALGKKVNHIPAQNECSQCHTDTSPGGFTASIFMGTIHAGLSTGCEGCHNTQFFPATPTAVKAANHLPTNQDCRFCHTNVFFTPQIFNHAGITSNCTSCHDGNYVVSAGALGKTVTHPVTSSDCGVCNGIGANFTDGIFDHTGRIDNCVECHGDGATGAVTKKNAGHVQTNQDCSVCHVTATFTTAVFNHVGITTNCVACHEGVLAVATVKSVNHIPTTQDCFVCHNTTAFAGARFDHQGIVSNCASCHDGNSATGKDGNHVPTSNDCSVCHQTTGFVPATFDHIGIVDNCVSCHDGALAQGKTNVHVQTNQDCGVCHNTTGFVPSTFDHSSVSVNTRCDSCHGVTATGKTLTHVVTSLDCRSCHTTATFLGSTFTHDASSVGRCDECHNNTGGGATPKPSQGHISTDVQCDVCHTTSGWGPTSFSHDPQGNYPGRHRQNLTCGDCHGNIVTLPFVYPSAQYAPFCAACHAGDFRRNGNHNGGSNGTIAQNKNCGSENGCHSVSSSGF